MVSSRWTILTGSDTSISGVCHWMYLSLSKRSRSCSLRSANDSDLTDWSSKDYYMIWLYFLPRGDDLITFSYSSKYTSVLFWPIYLVSSSNCLVTTCLLIFNYSKWAARFAGLLFLSKFLSGSMSSKPCPSLKKCMRRLFVGSFYLSIWFVATLSLSSSYWSSSLPLS